MYSKIHIFKILEKLGTGISSVFSISRYPQLRYQERKHPEKFLEKCWLEIIKNKELVSMQQNLSIKNVIRLNEYLCVLSLPINGPLFDLIDLIVTFTISIPRRFWRMRYTGWSEQENLLFAIEFWISAIHTPASQPCTLFSQSVRYSHTAVLLVIHVKRKI